MASNDFFRTNPVITASMLIGDRSAQRPARRFCQELRARRRPAHGERPRLRPQRTPADQPGLRGRLRKPKTSSTPQYTTALGEYSVVFSCAVPVAQIPLAIAHNISWLSLIIAKGKITLAAVALPFIMGGYVNAKTYTGGVNVSYDISGVGGPIAGVGFIEGASDGWDDFDFAYNDMWGPESIFRLRLLVLLMEPKQLVLLILLFRKEAAEVRVLVAA